MLKLVMMPPQNDLQRQWAPRLQRSLPAYCVVVPETEAEARRELVDADAAYGWVPPEALPAATKLRWLQNPQAGPAPGYYYPALIAGAVAGSAGLPGGATAAALGPERPPASLYLPGRGHRADRRRGGYWS